MLCAWCALQIWLQHNALSLDDNGAWAGHLNIWSDWPLHLAISGFFADRPPTEWLSDHPMFAGEPLHYPFVVNLLSGLLLRVGVDIDAAMTLPVMVAACATPLVLFLLFRETLRDDALAVGAVSLLFLGSGLGGFSYLAQTLDAGDWAGLLYPAIEVSRLDRYDWYSGNVLTGMLVPQRAFVLGLPVAALSLWLFVRALERGSARAAIAGGALAGLLPIVHTHSYLALALICAPFTALHLRAWRIWLPYGALAALLGAVLVRCFLAIGDTQHLRWDPGFSAPAGFISWVMMWLRLWGLAIPLALIALPLLRGRSRSMWAMAIGGALCFGFANLFLVQPNRWDNSKIFLWTYLCWAPLWALLIAHLWRQPQAGTGRLLALGLALAMTFTGLLEVMRLANVEHSRTMIANAQDVQLAREVRTSTPPRAVFLTDTTHNHPVMAFGARPIFLGFTGWMANFGFDHRVRDAHLRRMFAGGAEAEVLLQRYGIDFVVVGPGERRLGVDEAWLSEHHALRFSNRDYRIYEVGSPGPAALE